MKLKITRLLFLAFLLLSGFGTLLSGQTTTTSWLDSDTLQAASPYFAPLLKLEGTPPADSQTIQEYSAQLLQDKANGTHLADRKSIAFPVSGGLMAALCNMLARDQDLFNIYSNNETLLGPCITRTLVQKMDGTSHYHYSCNKDQRNTIVGYLSCMDIQLADEQAAAIAGANTPYEIYNSLGVYQNWNTPDKVNHKIFTANLGYNYLSSTPIESLSGYYTDPKHTENYVSIGNQAYPIDLTKSNIPQNCYSLTVSVAFKDSVTDDSDNNNYGDVYDRNDPNGNYGDFSSSSSSN